MPKLSSELLESMIMSSVDAAAAPRHSAKYQHTPDILEPLFQEGDLGDAWIVVVGLTETIIQTLSLREQRCVCGSDEHHAKVTFGFAPINDDGTPDIEHGFFGDPADAPEEIRACRPEMVIFAQMVNAEIANDSNTSVELWRQAEAEGVWVQVLNLALKQAGRVRRDAIAQSGAN